MNNIPSYLVRQSDGRWLDTRLKYGPGTRLRITGGPHKGYIAMVDRLVGTVKEGERWVPHPGYNATLDDGRWITIRWDLVESIW